MTFRTIPTALRALPLIALVVAALASTLVSCNDDDNNWDKYKEWRELNDEFFDEQKYLMEDGRNYYQTITPAWNSAAQVLIRFLNDRSATEGNLSPLLTSTVDVKYRGELCDGTPFDSSYLQTAYGDSIFRTKVSGVISGWTIALQNMRVGDSARVIVPYPLAYGSSTTSGLLPYSTLVFDIKLVDIPYYEVRQ